MDSLSGHFNFSFNQYPELLSPTIDKVLKISKADRKGSGGFIQTFVFKKDISRGKSEGIELARKVKTQVRSRLGSLWGNSLCNLFKSCDRKLVYIMICIDVFF